MPGKPDGKTRGKHGTEYTYSSVATEPDNECLYYIWDWGDGNYSYWLGPYESEQDAEATYVWEPKGEYSVRVKVKDVYGGESFWSDTLPVKMPKNKVIYRPFLQFLEKHPNLLSLLKFILGL